MKYEIKDLIEKIQKEGIEEAEKKARQIEEEARQNAENIIKDAKKKAEEVLAVIQQQVRQLEEKTKIYLEQLARDTLVSLKNEINRILIEIVQKKIQETLSSQEIFSILEKIIISQVQDKEVLVYLSEKDFGRLKDTFIKELQEKIKVEILFVPSKEIDAGFQISFDNGRSYFDVTDKSLAEYLFKKLNLDIKEVFK